MSVTKNKLHLYYSKLYDFDVWDNKCAYQLCNFCVHDKSAVAVNMLLGVFMCIKVQPCMERTGHFVH